MWCFNSRTATENDFVPYDEYIDAANKIDVFNIDLWPRHNTYLIVDDYGRTLLNLCKNTTGLWLLMVDLKMEILHVKAYMDLVQLITIYSITTRFNW